MLSLSLPLTLCWAHGPGELCEDGEGAQPRADAVEVGDRRWRWGLGGGRDGAAQLGAGLGGGGKALAGTLGSSPSPKDELLSFQSSRYLSAGVWVVHVSWLLPPLVQAVVLTVAPLHHRRVLGGLGAVGYIQLHHNHTRA